MTKLPKNFDPRWDGATVVCVASGPSLTKEDIEYARSKADRMIVVNATYKLAPNADVCYGADERFWNEYILKDDYREVFKGEGWTMSYPAGKKFGLNIIGRSNGEGYSIAPGTINTGGNSGFQAIHLAAYWGASRIVMLGYDMQRTDGKEHWHGKHRGNLLNGRNFALWIRRLHPLLRELNKRGVKLLNATRTTAIPAAWAPHVTVENIQW